MKIGQKLKELRKSLGLSRIQFAEIIGVNPKTITFWENEKNNPSQSNLFTICNKCNLPDNYFDENVTQNVIFKQSFIPDDKIEINYWSELPEELKNPKIRSVWFDKEIIQNAWNMSADNLFIVPMIGDALSHYWYPIYSGDMLIIDTLQNNVFECGLYFATSQNNTRFWIREIDILANESIEFRRYSSGGKIVKTYTKQELLNVDFKIIGKVIKNVSFRL